MGWFKDLSKPLGRCLGGLLSRERKEDGHRLLQLIREEGHRSTHNAEAGRIIRGRAGPCSGTEGLP